MTPLEFAEQTLGFMIQVIPVSLLCYVPFEKQHLRFPLKKLIPCVLIIMTVFSVLFAVISFILWTPTSEHNSLLRIAANNYMLACILIWILLFSFTVRAEFTKKFLIIGILVHYAAVNFTLTSILMGFVDSDYISAPGPLLIYSYRNNLINGFLVLFICPFLYTFMKRVIKVSLHAMDNHILKRNCIYIILAFALFCACIYALNSLQFYYGFYGRGLLILLVSFILSDVILYYILFSEVRLTMQNFQLESQLRSFDEQYQKMSKNIEEVQRARHDIRHHLNVINEMNNHQDYKGISEYLKNYEASYRRIENMSLCSYPALDNILRYYLARTADEGIQVTTKLNTLRPGLSFDIIDITVMAGNLLDNALEACRRMSSDQERFIRIRAKTTEVSLLIQVENSCLPSAIEHPDFTDGSEFTTTKHAALHGQGLKSIRFIAEKYGGSAEFRLVNGVFTARIVLNIP